MQSLSKEQFVRKFSIIIANSKNEGLDLSQHKVNFEIKKTSNATPNNARIRIYNLPETVYAQIDAKKEFNRVQINAGYEANYGLIFDGTIQQARAVHEGVDTYLEIVAGDGDTAYLFATVNTPIAAGSTAADHMKVCKAAMAVHGTTDGYSDHAPTKGLPRGKVLYGSAHKAMRKATRNAGATYSIQDGRVQVVPKNGVLPTSTETATVLNSRTGLVGTPQASPEGIKGKCLLNPLLRIDSAVVINERDILSAAPKTDKDKQGTTSTNTTNEESVRIMADGRYRLLSVTYIGDSRDNDWYCEFIAIGLDESAPVNNQTTPGANHG